MPYSLTNLLPLLWMVFQCGLWQQASLCPEYEFFHKQEYCFSKSDNGNPDCIIECTFPDNFIINSTFWPNEKISNISILSGEEIEFDARSFSKIDQLQQVEVKNVKSLKVKTGSFMNSSSKHVRLEIREIPRVEIQSRAFYLLQGNLAVLISSCDEVVMGMDAIPWIQELAITQVDSLQLKESDSKNHDEPRTQKISLVKVNVNELPANFFPSSITDITISTCNVDTLRKNSVKVSSGENMTIKDSKFVVIESEAFNRKFTYFKRLILLENVTITELESNAIHLGGTNFSVIKSSIDTVNDHAFSLEMKKVLFHRNNFKNIKTSGIEITLTSHRSATITNNTLEKLSANAIQVKYTNDPTDMSQPPRASEFFFEGNILRELKSHSLHFNLSETIQFKVRENIFPNSCRCELLASFIKDEYVDSNEDLINTMYNDSQCSIPRTHSNCFHSQDDFLKISEFMQTMCSEPPNNCSAEIEPTSSLDPNVNKDVDILDKCKQILDDPVILSAILVACIVLLAIIVLTACFWFGRQRHTKHTSRQCRFSNFSHHLRSYLTHFMPSNPIIRSRSSTSITRVPVHDYAEVRPPKYVDSDEDTYICIDKATQTLPEELTQELLQTLRDKLDDPENYREARCMIEHLYDLIKVEECCNHNMLSDDIVADLSPDEGVDILTDPNENVYDTIGLDVLQQRRRRRSRLSKRYVHRGTRAPSPDKLSPQSYTNISYTNSMRSRKSVPTLTLPRPSLTEYMQPVDHQSQGCNESLYDYASLSSALDVAERRSNNSTASTRKLTTSYLSGPHLLTDYKEPCDVKVPIYTQLDEMVQRPLPLTPLAEQVNYDLGDTRGTRL